MRTATTHTGRCRTFGENDVDPRPRQIFVIAKFPKLPSAAGSGIEATETGGDMSEGGTSLVVMVQIDGVTDHRLQPDTLDRSVPTRFSPPGDHWRLAGTEHPQSEAEVAAQGWRYDALAAPF